MISAEDMESVQMSREPHSSHRMGDWWSDLVACASNDRFGEMRKCLDCGGRDVKASGGGSRYFDEELLEDCAFSEDDDDRP